MEGDSFQLRVGIKREDNIKNGIRDSIDILSSQIKKIKFSKWSLLFKNNFYGMLGVG
jgi:hypothetical protein